MTITINHKRTLSFTIPTLIFIASLLITRTPQFRQHTDKFSIAMLMDLLLVSPLAYYLIIRKSSISKVTVLRVFMLGIIVASALLSKNTTPVLGLIKTWVAPLAEATLIGYIVYKFYTANKLGRSSGQIGSDFLIHSRSILTNVFGNERAGNAIASEIAVFYYAFSGKGRTIDNETTFTCYKENGIMLVLGTFLSLFVIETTGVHFLFLLWNHTAAWILTGLSAYSCLQLFAHLRSLRSRPIVLTPTHLLLRNGIMGGDVAIELGNIIKIETTNKPVVGALKLALINGLENHTVAIYLAQPVVVTKAFGIKKQADILLVGIDKHVKFMEALEQAKMNYIR